jgi:hypothetical protein
MICGLFYLFVVAIAIGGDFLKVKLSLALLAMNLAFVGGCSDKVKEELKEGKEVVGNVFSVKLEFDTYLAQRDVLIEKDIMLSKQLDEEFYNEEDPTLALETVRAVLPKYEELLKEAGELDIKSSEIQGVHDVYVNSVIATIDALEYYKEGLYEGEENLMVLGDQKMNESVSLGDDSNEVLMDLADEYRIPLELVE